MHMDSHYVLRDFGQCASPFWSLKLGISYAKFMFLQLDSMSPQRSNEFYRAREVHLSTPYMASKLPKLILLLSLVLSRIFLENV